MWGIFLTTCKPVSFSRRTLLHGVSRVASCIVKFRYQEILWGWSFLLQYKKKSNSAEEAALPNETLKWKPAVWIRMNWTVHKLPVSFQ
jgi:hypothetical protein